MNLEIKQFPFQAENWLQEFEKPVEKRQGYEITESGMTHIQVAGLILGLPLEPFAYKKMIYELAFEQADVNLLQMGQMKQDVDFHRSQSIEKVMNEHRESGGMTMNELINRFDGEGLFPLRSNPSYYFRLRGVFLELLRKFEAHHQGTMNPDFERVVSDVIHWMWSYLAKNTAMKFVWYGDATKSEVYFLYFLFRLGKDVLVFHPEGKNILSLFADASLPIFNYPTTGPVEAIPKVKPMREATVAKKAATELDQIFHQEDSLLFKPWQFRDFIPQSVTLHTTFDEVALIGKAKAFVRPNFTTKNKSVHIPVLFTKICGTMPEKREYAKFYEELLRGEMVVTRQKFPFSWEIPLNKPYAEVFVNGRIDPERLMRADWWQYKQLPTGLQTGLAYAIARYVLEEELRALPGENVKYYLLAQAMELPKDILLMLQKFDYSQGVPRLVLFNNGDSGQMGRADVARLLLLNEFGIDIIILNPTGQNDIEQFVVNGDLFDTHWLPNISFKEQHQKLLETAREQQRPELKVKSILRGFIKKG